MVQTYLEVRSVFSGTPLLPHWVLVSDNYYLTDLPFYVVLSLLIGAHWTLLFIVPWLVYVLLLLVAADIAASPGRSGTSSAFAYGAALFLLGMLFPAGDSLLLVSAYHNVTILFVLVALWASGPGLARGERSGWKRLLLLGCLVFAVSGSDPFGDVFFIIPFVLVLVFRLIAGHGYRAANFRMLAVVVGTAGAGALFPLTMGLVGGFESVPAFNTAFAPFTDWGRDASAIAGGFLDLFSAQPGLLPGIAGNHAIAAIRLVVALFAAGSVIAVLARARHRPQDGVLQVLAVGCVVLVAADFLSFQFANLVGPSALGQSLRYVVPVYVFSSVIAARELADVLSRARPKVVRAMLASVAGGAVLIVAAGFGQQVVRTAQEPWAAPLQWQARLADWLERHNLHYGIGDYWTANVAEALSGGAVSMNAVEVVQGRLQDYRWVTDLLPPGRLGRPQFAAFTTPNRYGVTEAAIERAYGRPVAVYRWPHCLILVLEGTGTGHDDHHVPAIGEDASSIASR